MTHERNLRPGDLLEYRCPVTQIVFQWHVVAVCLGSRGRESLVQVEAVLQQPGYTNSEQLERPWVPEVMTRSLELIRRMPDASGE